MKTINETIQIEEIKTLLKGETIDFLELKDHNLKIKINGKDFKNDDQIKFILQVLNMKKAEFYLMDNILERYNNCEYWNEDLEEELRNEVE